MPFCFSFSFSFMANLFVNRRSIETSTKASVAEGVLETSVGLEETAGAAEV
jgi:hypothetical protein